LPQHWDICPLFWMRSAGFPFAMLDALRVERAAAAVDAALELEERGASSAERASAWERADAELAGELHAARVALRDMLLDQRVQEAIFLSSAEFYRNLGQHLERPIEERKSRSRQKEKTAAKYIQRFCAKNETISFYGPLAWGEVDRAAGVGLAFEPGAGSLVGSRRVSFEHWAVHRLARVISRDPEVAPQLAPRLSPSCHVDGATLFYPVARQTDLDARKVAVLERCDGETAWAEVIARLADHPAFAGPGPAALEVAQELLELRILTREILIPTVVMNPERELLACVAALSEPARARWEPRLRALCEAAERFAGASLPERIQIFAELGRAYQELTGDAPSRREGEMYAARTLLYEDCERNVRDLVMGEPIARRLESVAPLLDIARWVTGELPRRYQSRFLEVFRRLSGGLPAVDFVQFVRETQWLAEDKRIEGEMREEIEAAWREVIGSRWPAGDGAVEHVMVTAEDCRQVLARLDLDGDGDGDHGGEGAGRPEILGARFLSPDFLLAATADEIRAGQGLIVMGELHKAVFLAAQPVAQPFCPARDRLLASVQRAVPGPVLSIVDAPLGYQRSDFNWPDLPGFYEILTEGATSRFPPERVVPVGALEVTEEDGNLYVATRDGRLRTWLFSVLSGFLYRKLLAVDPIELSGRYAPRILLDEIVVRRQRWQVDSEALASCRARPDSAALLGAARRFQRQLGMPDRIFVKSPNEIKPIYIDFQSFFLVELLFKLASEAPTLSITEMLPGADELWLGDAQGGRYTSEIRMSFFRSREPKL
jgi:hypothetical protein